MLMTMTAMMKREETSSTSSIQSRYHSASASSIQSRYHSGSRALYSPGTMVASSILSRYQSLQ
jgi:hypothetical protein